MKKIFFSDVVSVCGALVKFTGATEWEDYDEDLSHNGGSYYQPTHEITWSDNGSQYTLTIEDTSCGDLGARICATLDRDGARVCAANYGSLSGDEYTDFGSDFVSSVALAIAESIGYHIPTATGLCRSCF